MDLTAAERQIITILRSIDSAIKAAFPPAGGGVGVADDADLDGKYGNPVVKFDPRDWRGESCKGLTMADCPAEFLDLLAGTFEYFAKKAEKNGDVTNAGKPVAPYNRRDAARARGWAARNRHRGPAAVLAPESAPAWAADAAAEPINFGAGGFEETTVDDIPF